MERIITDQSGQEINEDVVREFQRELVGRILWPSDGKYEDARRVWNASVDRHPAAIVRCEGVPDVNDAVNFARDNNLKVSVRGGGHGLGGDAVCDGGIVLDLSTMIGVLMDPKARNARVEAGCTWHELDASTQAFGLATPGGIVSTSGVAGHTLGGGTGWLVRKRGLTCDNLLSVDLITADGQRVTASAEQNEDLFWGLRGGGGNLGVVTSFEFQLHKQGPVLGGELMYPVHRAPELLRFFRDFMAKAPWELTAYAAFATGQDGEPCITLTVCYCAEIEEGERVLATHREFITPTEDRVQVLPYTQMQRLMDSDYPPGNHNYWKSGFLDELTDSVIDTLAAQASETPSSLKGVEIILEHYGGKASIPDPDATAFPHRMAPYNLVVRARWMDPAQEGRLRTWVDDTWGGLLSFSNGGMYLNYITDGNTSNAQAAFGTNLDRLTDLKRRYDPDSLFDLNSNLSSGASR